jgi:hypothetical protein
MELTVGPGRWTSQDHSLARTWTWSPGEQPRDLVVGTVEFCNLPSLGRREPRSIRRFEKLAEWMGREAHEDHNDMFPDISRAVNS